MNWPPLHQQSSDALAQVLRDVVHKKPKDLFEYVAQALQDQSAIDPADFESYFEECKRKPRTYTLEDRCPAGQDPLTWVPMRFNDDTILLTLRNRASELTSEILAALPIDDTKGFLDRACVAFPELMYVREQPSETVASQRSFNPVELHVFQTLRAVYLACTGCEGASMDDESVEFGFLCEALVKDTRAQLQQAVPDEATLEALIVFLILRALGSRENFQRGYGGGHTVPEKAALHAIRHEVVALPSFSRLAPQQRALVESTLEAFFPLHMVVTSEAVPGHFLQVKETLSNEDGGLNFYMSALAVDHLVYMRCSMLSNESVDLARIGAQSLLAVEKYSAPRAYELLLKKRAERHSWRIVRDDLFMKAIVRVCCFSGREDTDFWNQVLNSCEELPDQAKEVLKVELARKDGCVESPVYILLGAGRYMEAAASDDVFSVGVPAALILLTRILEDASRHFHRALSINQRMVHIDLHALAKRAQEHRGGGVPFEDIPFTLKQVEPCSVIVELAGGAQ